MSPIFRISRRRRLAAYKHAGERLDTRDESYMCLALKNALRLDGADFVDAILFADAVWHELYNDGDGGYMTLAGAVYADDYKDAGVDCRNLIAVDRHRRSIRLTVVAFLHALDEAGNLEDIVLS